MKARLSLILAIFLLALPAMAQITVSAPVTSHPKRYTVRFTVNHAVNTITDPIPACASMRIIFDQGTAGAVTAYAVTPADDTVAEVEGNGVSLGAFIADGASAALTPTRPEVRFVVDTQETSGNSNALIFCSDGDIS